MPSCNPQRAEGFLLKAYLYAYVYMCVCIHAYIYVFQEMESSFIRNRRSLLARAAVHTGRRSRTQPFSSSGSVSLAGTQWNSRSFAHAGNGGLLHSLLHQRSCRKLACSARSIPAASLLHPCCIPVAHGPAEEVLQAPEPPPWPACGCHLLS